jgi:hypothetical protein
VILKLKLETHLEGANLQVPDDTKPLRLITEGEYFWGTFKTTTMNGGYAVSSSCYGDDAAADDEYQTAYRIFLLSSAFAYLWEYSVFPCFRNQDSPPS